MHPTPEIKRSYANGALGLAWALFFAAPLSSSGVPFYRDMLVTAMPLRRYINERLLQGELPQWYPYESLGVPLIGQIATTLFHPATLWMLPLPAGLGLKVTLLLAYLAALTGAYRFTRALQASRLGSLTAAFAYGFGGYTLGVSSILHYAISQGTLPWLALWGLRLFSRRRTQDCAWVALGWASLFLAGDAQAYLLAAPLLAGLFALHPSKRGAALGLLAGMVSVLLCGIEYLPARVLAAESVRGTGTPTALLAQTWSLAPARLVEFFVPGFIPEPQPPREELLKVLMNARSIFSSTVFVGGTVLALVLAGLRSRGRRGKRLFAGMAALALCLSLGQRGFLLPLAQSALPLLARFRYPEKYLAWMWLAGCPLVAWGMERLRHAPKLWAWGLLMTSAAFVAAGVGVESAGAASPVWALAGHTLSPDSPIAGAIDAAWSRGLLSTGVSLGVLGLTAILLRKRPDMAWLIPVTVFVELWQANAGHLPLVPPQFMDETPPFVAAMRAAQQPNTPLPRMHHERVPYYATRITDAEPIEQRMWIQSEQDMLPPDVCGLYGINSLGMNLGGESVRHHKVWSGALATRYDSDFNACFAVTPLARQAAAGETEQARDEALGMKLLSHPCRPRAFLTGTVNADSMAAAWAVMQKGALAEHVVWEGGPELGPSSGDIVWLENAPERLALQVQAAAPTALVISNALGTGWSAEVDGASAPVYPAMVAAAGIALPAGQHRVVFNYETPQLRWGAAMTALGLLAVGLLAGRRPARLAAGAQHLQEPLAVGDDAGEGHKQRAAVANFDPKPGR